MCLQMFILVKNFSHKILSQKKILDSLMEGAKVLMLLFVQSSLLCFLKGFKTDTHKSDKAKIVKDVLKTLNIEYRATVTLDT